MRVITGTAKGRKLSAPAGLATRPTLQMVKESIFSSIQFEIEGALVLDLFAGSGQMGIEALSRGAYNCVFVDNSKDCKTIIQRNLLSTGFADKGQLYATDVFEYLKHNKCLYEIIFADPPYKQEVFSRILPNLSEILSNSGIIICESSKNEFMPDRINDIYKSKEYKYSVTKITIYRRNIDKENR